MRQGRGGRLAATLCLLVVTSLIGGLPGARAATAPSLELFALDEELTIARRNDRLYLWQLGVWATPVGGAFDVRVWRDNYRSPVQVVQVDPDTGTVVRSIPADLLAGWTGFADFLRIGIWDEDGVRVASASSTFCPNGERERLNDEGPMVPTYPPICTGNPLTKGTVWGIDEGWAVRALGWRTRPRSVQIDDGRYTVRVSIARPFADLLDVAPADRTTTIDLTLVRRTAAPQDGGSREPPASAPSGAVPEDPDPDPTILPDLRALPPFGFHAYHRRGRDYLAFAATEWNAGPSPLVVEGFRRRGERLMDAYQYFYPDADGPAVGRAPVGTLEFHDGNGHHHWHFEEFTEYSMLDADRTRAVVSGKQSWCLVPTDPIDLTVPEANWTPWSVGLDSACGGSDSLWVREHLDAGWGDTYYQSSAGQAFDITGLPNGRYFVKVHVNPTDVLFERSKDNNVRLRRVRLLGTPGDRRVVVPPWNGIDTEGRFRRGFE